MQKQRLIEGWEFYKGTLGGLWEIWRRNGESSDYFLPWEQIKLPHCFNSFDAVDPDTPYYQGSGWYCNRIAVSNPYPNGRTLLHFEGAGQKTEVFVGDCPVGSHQGGYDEFLMDLTDVLKKMEANEGDPGVVPLAIKCDNSRDLETIPSDLSDFNLYGGIYRYLNLVYVPAISLERLKIEVETVTETSAKVVIKGSLYNPEAYPDNCSLKIIITGLDRRILQAVELEIQPWEGLQVLSKLEIAAPALWSPEEPHLYTCTVQLKSDFGETEVSERFGIRFFEFVKHGPFKLNGRRLLLKGTHRHEDHAGVGAAMTEEQIKAEMLLIKEMGVNFIRLGHYQQSRIVLDLCDELGILVWEEIPWCRGGLGGLKYQQQAVAMLTNMITQHYNHPSIIIWGLGNENDWPGDFKDFDQKAIRHFMRELHNLAHQLDPSRKTAIRRCDFCKDIIDVYSPSIWAGWYRGIYTEYEEYTRREYESVDHFLHVEWGADSLAGRHEENPKSGFGIIKTGTGGDERQGDYLLTGGEARISRDGDWSETYFCELIDWYLSHQENMPWLTGTAQWVFKDFSTPIRPENPIPYMNIKGVVERDLTLKEAYYVFQSYWTAKPMVHILGHRMPVRWGAPGEIKTVRIFSNCNQAELYLNGKSCGVKKRNSNDFPAAGLRWELVFNPGNNHLEVWAEKDGIRVWDEIEFIYQLEPWTEPAEFIWNLTHFNDQLVWLEVTAVDAAGVFCPDAKNFIRFGLTGDGKLIDNLGTVNGSRYRQLASGRAAILINTGGGRSVVSITSRGIKTKFVTVE